MNNMVSENERFSVADALRYAPKGLKLYSPIFGEVEFEKIDEDNWIQVRDKYNNLRWFYEYGTYFPSDENNYSEGECLLFPSTHCRTWNHWQNTLFLESIGSVCIHNITGNKFILGKDGTCYDDSTGTSYHHLIDDEYAINYLLDCRYATPEEAKEFFEELDKNGYKWDGKMVVKKEVVPHKFKVGDIVKFDRPSATVKHEILSIDFENERYLTRRTDIGGAIKEFIYFCEQDDYVIVGSHCTPSLEDKVNILADEILALKQRVLALEIQVIKDMSTPPLTKDPYLYPDKVTCANVFKTSDKAGDDVTLEDMKG